MCGDAACWLRGRSAALESDVGTAGLGGTRRAKMEGAGDFGSAAKDGSRCAVGRYGAGMNSTAAPFNVATVDSPGISFSTRGPLRIWTPGARHQRDEEPLLWWCGCASVAKDKCPSVGMMLVAVRLEYAGYAAHVPVEPSGEK